MKKYKHFTPQDRDIIATKLSKGTSKQKIAHILNVHISSIYHEIKRNTILLKSIIDHGRF